MTDSSKKERKVSPFEIIAAIVLGILAIICFTLQMSSFSKETTAMETVLFNCLQFILTIGFAWFSTRAISRSEFERSLKQFGISAYRRISDIEKMMTRLQSEVTDMLNELPSEEQNRLRIINAIVADTNQVIKSSIDDWVDVIGDELIAIEKIRRLEYEKKEIKTTQSVCENVPTDNYLLKEIDTKIDELKSSLPPVFRVAAEDERQKELEVSVSRCANWVLQNHVEQNGLLLKVVAGSNYGDIKDVANFNPNGHLWLSRGSQNGIDVVDVSGVNMGRVMNPITVVPYTLFCMAMEMCYGKLEVNVEFIAVVKKYSKKNENLIHYTVKVIDSPVHRLYAAMQRDKSETI